MYPKKTLSAASLLSECERKRCRSLEARGCAKSESEFSMGTAATCPFIMSEQNPRNIKLHHQYMHEVTNNHYDKLKFSNLLEDLLHLAEKAFLLRIDLVAAEVSKLLQEFLLPGGQLLRCQHLDAHMLVAIAVPAEHRNALAP